MPYLPTTSTYEPSHTPPSDSQPVQFSLLPTSRIYALYTLIISSPTILIAVEGLSSYQIDITCQLLVQLLHHVALAQIQHFRACPSNLPDVFGLPLRTTLSLLPGPILELLHANSFHRYLEELPSEVLYPAFRQVYLSLTRAEQHHYRGQTGTNPSPATLPLALRISSCPSSPTPSSVADDTVIGIQVAEGQWITSSASRVLVQNSHPDSPNTQCYHCLNLGHHGLSCPMYTCPTCRKSVLGHAAHHCLATQCDFCHQWGHSDEVCNLQICGRCNALGHVVDNCPVDPATQPGARYTYWGTYSDDDDLNTLVDDN